MGAAEAFIIQILLSFILFIFLGALQANVTVGRLKMLLLKQSYKYENVSILFIH